MRFTRALHLWVRLVFAATLLASSFYCLLGYVPFTYYHFLQFSHFGWLDWFARWQHDIYAATFGLVAASLLSGRREDVASIRTRGFLIFGCATALVLCVRPVLGNLHHDISSYLWSLFFLVPLLWLGAGDLITGLRRIGWSDRGAEQDARLLGAAASSALFTATLGFLVAGFRTAGVARLPAGWPGVLGWSLTEHLVLFMGLFLVLGLLHKLAHLLPAPVRGELLLFPVLAGLLLSLCVREIALAGIAFTGTAASIYSLAWGFTLACFLLGTGLRLGEASSETLSSGLEPLLRSLAPAPDSNLAVKIAWLLVVSSVYAWGLTIIGPIDWDFRLQKVLTSIVWLMVFSTFFFIFRNVRMRSRHRPALLLVPLASAGLFMGINVLAAPDGSGPSPGGTGAAAARRSHSGHDISFRLVDEALTSPPEVDLYRFLQKNTNIPHEVHVDPVEIHLVERLDPKVGERPDIYIFTVDSLRRDYLSPYDERVDFTPEIESFARESIVFRNSFSHYGASGLSEPSIWTGGLLLHKQYVSPYGPMNTLQKLLEADGYRLLIAMDTILSRVMRPSPAIEEIKTSQGRVFPLCDSLAEIERTLDARPDDGPPIFAYVQPQDVHISVINRAGRDVPGGGAYEGHDAPYASRVARMDGCLGEFIDDLKRRDLYDRSIIVLTSDHGDSLGEEGRWGHAYTIYEEVIAVPLILHVPDAMRRALTWDEDDIAFTTDITPTLYYLLGHRPVLYESILGRPLLTGSPQEAKSYLQEDYLVASSYGAVYGILRDNGRLLFIADGVNFVDHYYALGASEPVRSLRITPAIRSEYHGLIREKVEAIHQFYRFPARF